ncbi:hypothetical protein DXG01_015645 [Tephrocybe rancida]|nr:hypothetical protein DXG01_015645 [Tephrocybe rancida]
MAFKLFDLPLTAHQNLYVTTDHTGWFSMGETSTVEESINIQNTYAHIQDDPLHPMLPPGICSRVRASGIVRKLIVSKIAAPRPQHSLLTTETEKKTRLKDSTVTFTYDGRTKQADVHKMVKRDLDLYCRVAAVDAFINHYFKVSTTIIDKVLEKMEELGHYDPTGERWQWNDAGVFKDMPSSSAKESVFYSPLANICEAIRKAHITKHFDSRWIVSANNPPKSPDQNASLIRPDIVLLLGMESEVAEWEKALKELANDETKLIKVITAWWLKIGAIIEVKRKEDKDQMEHITQLMSHLRQLLREQSDRWFVPGLMFSDKHLAVWVADRSGALGTERSFDIHKHPKLFIQVILGCSSLEPQQLGYDTTMQLWKSPSEYLPSYSDNININITSGKTYIGKLTLLSLIYAN